MNSQVVKKLSKIVSMYVYAFKKGNKKSGTKNIGHSIIN